MCTVFGLLLLGGVVLIVTDLSLSLFICPDSYHCSCIFDYITEKLCLIGVYMCFGVWPWLDRHLLLYSFWLPPVSHQYVCCVVFIHASNFHAEISDAPLASTYLLMKCFFFSQGWTDFSAFSLAGYTHRDALLHLQTELCDWLAGGAHWDEDVLFQCGHTGGHEWLGQVHEPGCTDANPYSEEVSESQNFTKTFS